MLKIEPLPEGDSNMGKIVVIDTDECIGCESCVELCPEVFAFKDEEEKAEVIMPEGGPEDCIEEAMETCPVECIYYEE
jgi:ferredoxin